MRRSYYFTWLLFHEDNVQCFSSSKSPFLSPNLSLMGNYTVRTKNIYRPKICQKLIRSVELLFSKLVGTFWKIIKKFKVFSLSRFGFCSFFNIDNFLLVKQLFAIFQCMIDTLYENTLFIFTPTPRQNENICL